MDSLYWGNDAGKFNPHRFLLGNDDKRELVTVPDVSEAFLPFGSGARACIGQKLAVRSISSFFATLVENYECVQEHVSAPAPDTHGIQSIPEPNPDDSKVSDSKVLEPYVESGWSPVNMDTDTYHEESSSLNIETERSKQPEIENSGSIQEPKLDDSGEGQSHMRLQDAVLPDQMGSILSSNSELLSHANSCAVEPYPHDAPAEYMQSEPDPDDPELKIIQESVAMFCNRLQNAIDSLKYEAKPSEAGLVLQTLVKIIRVDNILIRGLKWSKLLDLNKRGQWWLSGDLPMITENVEEVAGTIDKEISETQKMIELAAAQRMNTDPRRAIFCVITSGEDYIDAFEKHLRLDLPGKQDREIKRVLVECCLQEKVFNKYYCVLATKLCCHDKNHKFTLQYC